MDAPVIALPQHVRCRRLGDLSVVNDATAAGLNLIGTDKLAHQRGRHSAGQAERHISLQQCGQHYRFDMSCLVIAPQSCSPIFARLAWGGLGMRTYLYAMLQQRLVLQALPKDQWPLGFLPARKFLDCELGICWTQCQMRSCVTGANTIRIYSPMKKSHGQDSSGMFIR